ncbi:MAG: DUF2333 family protein [Alphaproteobacteria bacterium]|nr:DUF2333 family protein [Alphaproteobacteria bacterium]
MLKEKLLQLIKKVKQIFLSGTEMIKKAFNSWPKAFIGVFIFLILAYYPLGGKISENIDKTIDYDFSSVSAEQSQTVELAAYLINREVNENIWTANLPFFFPAYSLDNMPNFQTGIVQSLARVTKAISSQIQCLENEKEIKEIKAAAKLLSYPSNVWLFHPDNKLKMAPSSSAQYKKARKKLKDFNVALKEEKCFWIRDKESLYKINKAVIKGLSKAITDIENEIREGSNRWTDTKADDVFYLNQGRVYAFMLILKKLGRDYKQVLMSEELYQDWTIATRALQNAVEMTPEIVVNGKIDDSLKPNHLMNLGYYIIKTENILTKINIKLNGESKNAN